MLVTVAISLAGVPHFSRSLREVGILTFVRIERHLSLGHTAKKIYSLFFDPHRPIR
jgi:hypothetical protein